ncbi:CBL-interacting protein kinase 2-like [Impatiens glandulifera]|uniref:CBL-interacting protein kinase 2-like n=1 Tax=Impatiens glandulifera TaxID=253017 RepID=UPI001FB0F88B|nr:CBL-interacting protein kinase 2-like [Impatiens glandulifera]
MEKKGSVLIQKYELGRLLGQGTFAKVYYARNLETSMSVAIKVIDKEKVMKAGMMDQIKREISVMRLVKHPHIVQLYEIMASRTKIYFVMEYVKGGELFKKIAKGKLKEDIARKYFQQLISAVDFCHSRGVYHRDLKPENILLDENGILKVSDFGLSTLSESKCKDSLLHTTCGTPAYVAPEVINRKGYNGKTADVWSCGVVLYVLVAGYLPFYDANLMDMYKKISKGEFKYPNWFNPEMRTLLSNILDPDPVTRIPIEKIMEHTWFRKGLNSKVSGIQLRIEEEPAKCELDSVFGPSEEAKPVVNLNAFDIISLSEGFDLSGLFEKNEHKKEVRFTSRQTAKMIILKFEEMAKKLKMIVAKKEGGMMKFERLNEGRKGMLLIQVEIFEVTSSFHLIEMKKSNGDSLEYRKVMNEDIRPALKDVIWTWQGDKPSSTESSVAATASYTNTNI